MRNYLEQAERLHEEATELLRETDLVAILKNYGEVYLTGSYLYEVMTWRDIDLCLQVEHVDIPAVFELGRVLSSLPHVGFMYYRNEFVLKTPGNPRAVFWCVDFVFSPNAKWKVDILISTTTHVKPIVDEGRELSERLTPRSRETVIKLKSVLGELPGYRREFRSSDIYTAVLDHGVTSVEEWHHWWKNWSADGGQRLGGGSGEE